MSKGPGPQSKPKPKRGPRRRRTILRAALAGAAVACGGRVLADETRVVSPSGYALTVTGGRTAVLVGTGFRVGLPDSDRRRDPVEIDVAVVDPPAPPGLSRCSFWSAWPRCAWSWGEAGGSSGAPVTLEMYEQIDGGLVRYRQTRHADGARPVFEAIEWRRSGDLRVERLR